MDFLSPQHGRGIGGKKGIAGAGGKYDHTTLFKMSNGSSDDKRFRHLMHGDGALNPCMNIDLL